MYTISSPRQQNLFELQKAIFSDIAKQEKSIDENFENQSKDAKEQQRKYTEAISSVKEMLPKTSDERVVLCDTSNHLFPWNKSVVFNKNGEKLKEIIGLLPHEMRIDSENLLRKNSVGCEELQGIIKHLAHARIEKTREIDSMSTTSAQQKKQLFQVLEILINSFCRALKVALDSIVRTLDK